MLNKFLCLSKNVLTSDFLSCHFWLLVYHNFFFAKSLQKDRCDQIFWFGMANCAEYYSDNWRWWPLLCRKSFSPLELHVSRCNLSLRFHHLRYFFLCLKKIKIEMYRKGYAMLRATDVHKNLRQIVLQVGMWEVVKKTYIFNRKLRLQATEGSKNIFCEDHNADIHSIFIISIVL